MKKTIKMLSLVMAMAMMLCCFAACGEKEEPVKLQILDTEYITEDYAIALNLENADLLAKIDGALADLKADGTVDAIVNKYISGVAHELKFQENTDGLPVLKMGTNAEFPPYEYHEGDAIVGIDAEIAAAICDKLGYKLEIEDMSFDSIIPSVQSGKIDFGMAGLTVTDERKTQVNFTASYATGVQVVIVKEGSEITSVEDLTKEGANYTIGVQNATTGDLYATWDIEDEGLGKVERYNKGADAVQALVTGKIDCVIIDNEPAKAFVEANNK